MLELVKQRQERVDSRSGQIPWLHRRILIIGGPFRSRTATIYDVQTRQTTRSSLKIVAMIDIQGTSYGNQVLLDYDHAIDLQYVQTRKLIVYILTTPSKGTGSPYTSLSP